MIDTYCVSGALCSEAWDFWSLFRKRVLSGAWSDALRFYITAPRIGGQPETKCPRSFPPQKNNPSEAKAKTLRHYPKSGLAPPSGKGSKNSKASPQRAPENAVRTNYALPLRVPFAVKFLEFLEPSPKEGSKRGLGQRPKVFSSGSKRGLGQRPKVFAPRQAQDMVVGFSSVIRMGERKVMAFLSPSSMVMTLSSCSMERTRS